jgi:hypothetical protein
VGSRGIISSFKYFYQPSLRVGGGGVGTLWVKAIYYESIISLVFFTNSCSITGTPRMECSHQRTLDDLLGALLRVREPCSEPAAPIRPASGHLPTNQRFSVGINRKEKTGYQNFRNQKILRPYRSISYFNALTSTVS